MAVAGIAIPAVAGKDDVAAQLHTAEASLARGRPREARSVLIETIRDHPENATAHLLQGRVYLLLGDGVAAEAEVERARQGGVRPERTRHLLAEAYLLQGDADRALAELNLRPVAAPFAAEVARVRGRALAAAGDTAGAAGAFGEALKLAPRSAALWVDIGRFRLGTGEALGAIVAADRAVALDGHNGAALLFKGELVRSQYGLVAALPWFDRALAADPQSVPALLAKAATLGDIGRTQAMLAETRAVIALEPLNATAFYLQAVMAARAGNFVLARSLMQRTGGVLDDQPSAMLLSGAIEYRLGNNEQAIERLDKLVTLQPGNVKARRLLGAARWRTGDARSTIEVLQPLVPQADSYALILMARAYETLGDRGKAAAYLDRAAMPVPGGGSTPADPDALATLRRNATIDPAAAAPRVALIRALLEANQLAEALTEAQALAQANPGAPAAHMLAGDALLAAGRPGDAAEAYRRAANIAFTEPVAMRLVDALRQAGRADAASRVLALFLAQNPRNVAARLVAADFMMGAGAFDRAIPVLEGLRARLGERDAALLNNLAWAYFRGGRAKDAIAVAARAHALAPANPAVADSYGWMLFASRSDRTRGTDLIEQAAAQAPGVAMVRWHLAQAYAALGRNEAARSEAEAALALPGFADAAQARALLARL